MPRIPVTAYAVYDDAGNSVKAERTAAIASAAATTVVKSAAGRVISATITTAGSSSDNATIYDNTAGSGTILAVIAGGGTVGAQQAIDLPAAVGITVVNVASGPAFTLGYS
jgi:hypothetical protein